MVNAEVGLYELLLERITRDSELEERPTQLLLAAWTGDDQLRAVLAGENVRFPTAEPEPVRPPEVFLSAVHVQGFRGVGPHATLKLDPGPGLTLVTGRNGSGKSSFAEAAELALTGDCGRWTGRSSVWRDGWRNLHEPAQPGVAVDLLTAGTPGVTSVARAWKDNEDVADGAWTTQATGAKRTTFDGSAWRDDLVTYRPFLSYRELGNLLSGKPSDLHDALKSVLGLEPVAAAQRRLAQTKKELAEPGKAATAARKQLRARLETVDDERAARAAALLKSTSPDLAALADLALGGDDSERITVLRTLCGLTTPSLDDVAETTAVLRSDADRVAAAATDTVRDADTAGALLRAALRHHDHTGDGPCPVCVTGTLDSGWRERTASRAAELDEAVGELRSARMALDEAVQNARRLVHPAPVVLSARAPVDVAATAEAWHAWTEAAEHDQPAALGHALDTAIGPLTVAVAALTEAARTELDRLDEVWAPLARELAAWLHQAEQAAAVAPVLAELTAAETWLTVIAEEIRDERLAPFAQASQRVWERLRQQSNVELGPIRLTGTRTRREAKLDVRVDGAEGTTALSVMSQGELHSLALSLFLPRATTDDSPFRFVVIDDPVQAMDPAKVDGLAHVFADVAATRQVVVFTHDDRLTEAVRRLQLPATVFEVHRSERSVVSLRRCEHPVRRYLDDARAVCRTPEVPTQMKGEVVASYCRSAIEAACHTRIRAKRLGQGDRHVEVEQLLAQPTPPARCSASPYSTTPTDRVR
ncbi:MAG TPA: AAA family ATPase [Pseudonocardia sp.]|nr:AAA family ATPase [Pseudonocardia sp.]